VTEPTPNLRRLAKQLSTLRAAVTDLQRQPQLANSSIEDGGVNEYDVDGKLGSTTGKQYDGTHGAVTFNGPTPPTPSWASESGREFGVSIIGGVIFHYEGMFVQTAADSAAGRQTVAPLDFVRTELHTSPTMPTPSEAISFETLRGSTSSPRGTEFVVMVEGSFEQPIYAWLVARASSGKASVPSDVIGPYYAGRVNPEDMNVDLGQLGGVDSFAGPDAPTTTKTGSLWLKTPGNLLHRWDGDSWEPYADANIQIAITNAADAKQLAATAQGQADSALSLAGSAGDLADTAIAVANGKNKATYSTVSPTIGSFTEGSVAGDVWYTRSAVGWIQGIHEYTADKGWQYRAFQDTVLGTVTAAKIGTGTLDAAVAITIGNPAGNRLVLSGSNGIQGIQRVNNVDIVNFGFDIATGNSSLRGVFRTLDLADRAVVISSNIQAAGGNVGQPGILFKNPTIVNRWAQIWSDNSDLHLDGPAYTTGGVTYQGSSIRLNIDGLNFYTVGDPSNNSSAYLSNGGGWQFGVRRYETGQTQATVYGGPDDWFLGNSMSGTRIKGDKNGNWEIGDLNTTRPRLFGTQTAWLLGKADVRVYANPDGTWGMGHTTDQSVYTVGSELVLRGRSTGGSIGVYPASGSWFDIWPSGAGGMYVHGTFGATVKNFIIDHPTDPERQLVHASTESPTAGVEYWGMADLDKNGEAVVELPPYFEALTFVKGRAVLITPIGRPVPVGAEEIEDGRFTVYGAPNGKVSWLVKASRRNAEFEVEPLRKDSSITQEDESSTTPPESSEPAPPVVADPVEERRKSRPPGWDVIPPGRTLGPDLPPERTVKGASPTKEPT